MPLVKTDPASRRNGPRVAIGPRLVPEVDELRGNLTRPEFLCRAGYYLAANPELDWTEEQQDFPLRSYRFAIDPELAEQLDALKGKKSRAYIMNKAGWVYVTYLKSLRI